MTGRPARRDIDRILADPMLIEAALRRAVREALARHKQAGNPVATWSEGRVKWVAPEDIDLSGPEP